MKYTIGSILCTAYIIFCLLTPSAAGSWIIQSISQEINEEGSGGLQNSVQIAGASNDDVFIVQNIMQEAGVNVPDIRDMATTDGNGQVIAESNTPEDINKLVDEIINRDDKSGLVLCIKEFPRIENRLQVTNESMVEDLRTIDNRNFIEDIISQMDGRYDLRDAPDQYHTLLVCNGARHFIMPGVYLGKKIGSEADGQPNINATEDDINEVEDEDGIIFTSALKPGENSLIDVTASSPGFLSAWMDFNCDGDWTEEVENILSDLYLDAGVNHVVFDVPAKALQGDTYSLNSTLFNNHTRLDRITDLHLFEDHPLFFCDLRQSPFSANFDRPELCQFHENLLDGTLIKQLCVPRFSKQHSSQNQ